MKFIYITASVLLLIIFSINLNFFGIKNEIYKTYPNVKLSKNIFNKQSIMHHFKNDYNDNFLPATQFVEIYSKVLFYEKIYIGKRIRDIKYHNDTKAIFLALESNGEIGILYQ